MKKLLILTILFFALGSASFAQKAFDDQTKLVSIGVGIGNSFWGTGLKSSPPVNPTLTIEKSLGDGFSAGTTFAYSGQKADIYGYKYSLNAVYLGGRAAYHFELPSQSEKVDLYAGAGLGYAIVWAGGTGMGTNSLGSSGLAYTVFGGGRYYFNPKLAVYGELGYGSFSILNLGLTFKIK